MKKFASAFFLQIFFIAGASFAAAAQNTCNFAPNNIDLQPFQQKLTLACEAFAQLCNEFPQHYNCLPVTAVTNVDVSPSIKFTKLNLEYKKALTELYEDFAQAADRSEGYSLNLYFARDAIMANETRAPELFRTIVVSLIDISMLTSDVEVVSAHKNFNKLRTSVVFAGGSLASSLPIINEVINGVRITKSLQGLFAPAAFIAAAGMQLAVSGAIRQHQISKLYYRMRKSSGNDIGPVMNNLYQIIVKENHAARDLMTFVRNLNSLAEADVNTSVLKLEVLRGNVLPFFAEINRPELTGAKFVKDFICETYNLLPPPNKIPLLNVPQENVLREKEQSILTKFSLDFLRFIKSQISNYNFSLLEYTEELNRLRQTFPDKSEVINQRLQAIHRWQADVSTFKKELELPTIWQDWLTHPTPNNTALKKIKTTAQQALYFEWQRQDPEFKETYECGDALPSL
jgi:hypothetical protein